MIVANVAGAFSKIKIASSYRYQRSGGGYLPLLTIFSRHSLVAPSTALDSAVKKSSEVKDGITIPVTG